MNIDIDTEKPIGVLCNNLEIARKVGQKIGYAEYNHHWTPHISYFPIVIYKNHQGWNRASSETNRSYNIITAQEYLGETETIMDIYNRQSNIDLHIPSFAVIAGCGGVGSWVALNMALSGVKYIYIIDNDKIETSNLNRTPFRMSDVGEYKTEAMKEIIEERRDIDVVSITTKIQDTDMWHDINFWANSDCELFDCRDNSSQQPLPPHLANKANITGGYDGSNYTLHLNYKQESVWGEGQVRYSVTPSWLCPPQLIANLITTWTLSTDKPSIEKIISGGIFDVIGKL